MPATDHARRLALGTAVNAVGAIATQGLELATLSIVFARIGGSGVAILVLAQSLTQWPLMFESGVGQAVVRIFASGPLNEPFDGEVRQRLSTAVAVYLALAAATLVLGLSIAHLVLPRLDGFVGAGRTRAFDLIAVGMSVRMMVGYLGRRLVGEVRLILLRGIDAVRVVTTFVLVLSVFGGPGGLVAVATAYAIGDVVAGVVGLAGVVRPHRVALPSRASAGALWAASRPLLVSNFLSIAWTRLDPVIVAVALGARGTAVYGLVLRVYDLLRSALELVCAGVLPATTRLLASANRERVLTLFHRAVLYVAATIWPVAALVAVFPADVLRLWLDRPLEGATTPLQVAMILVIVVSMPATAMYVIAGAGRVGDVLAVQVRAAVVNLATSVALVSWIGTSAVFVGTIAATVTVAPGYSGLVRDQLETSTRGLWRAVRRPATAVAVLVAVALVIRATTDGRPVVRAVEVVVVLAVYGAVVALWIAPREDVTRLLPRRSAQA